MRLLLVSIAMILPWWGCAQAPLTFSQLKAAVRNLERDPEMRSAQWSLTVMDASNGQMIYGHEAHRSLATASTMKALTTATALSVLGSEYRFETALQHDGSVVDGVLSGHLYIKGSGDPSLGSDRFGEAYSVDAVLRTWVRAIQAAGIHSIAGKVIGDAGLFSTQMTPGRWSWEDMGNYYGAGASGLNFHENLYYLHLKPGSRAGASTSVIRTLPAMPDLVFVNELVTGPVGSGDQAYIYGSPYTATRYLRGSIPAGVNQFTIKGSIADPAAFCARSLAVALQEAGISVEGHSSISAEHQQGRRYGAPRRNVHTHRSPPLRDIVFYTNQKSVNLFAEALLNRTALALNASPRTQEAVKAVSNYWRGRGVDTRGMYLRDGSGLSANNVMSTFQLCSIMCQAYQSKYYAAFNASLPVSGQSGSMRNIGRGTKAANNLRAKSGYISGVRAYTGYVKVPDGRTLAFSLSANYFSCSAGRMRTKWEKIMVAMANGS